MYFLVLEMFYTSVHNQWTQCLPELYYPVDIKEDWIVITIFKIVACLYSSQVAIAYLSRDAYILSLIKRLNLPV